MIQKKNKREDTPLLYPKELGVEQRLSLNHEEKHSLELQPYG